jgi:hypothetical protein
MSKPSFICVTCGEDFTRKTSAKRHKDNPNIHDNGNCNIVRFIEYVIGIAKGIYEEPSMLPPRLSSKRNKKKNKFFEGNTGEDNKVSTFPDLSKNLQICGNELDKRISTSSSIKEEKKHEEAIDYFLRITSRTVEYKRLLEKLSGRGQGPPLASSQNGHQNNEDHYESTKSTFMDDAIANARKLVKLQDNMRELYEGGSPWAPAAANTFCANSGFGQTDNFMPNRKDIFGFSATECRNCVSFEIVPQYFDTADKDGFHQVPHKCREQEEVLTHNLHQNRLYQNRKDMIISSKKLIEFWTERNVGMYAIDISNHTGESLEIKHPESDTKLIRVPARFDAAIYLDVERKAHEDEEKESKHWFHKVVGKNQIIPLKLNDLVRFLIKTNGSSYGIFRIPQTVNNCNAEHVGCSPQSKIYFIYLARYQNIPSRMVDDNYYYCDHDYDSNASLMEEERQNDELKENKLNIIGQPRTTNLLIPIILAMYLTEIFILRRPKRYLEGTDIQGRSTECRSRPHAVHPNSLIPNFI